MAIDPENVTIVNISQLNDATSVQDEDLLIVGQGDLAKKITVAYLKNLLNIDSIGQDVSTLIQDVESIDLALESTLKLTEQELNFEQQTQIQSNFNVYSVQQVDEAIQNAIPETPAEQTLQNLTIDSESQSVSVTKNKTIVRFNSVFNGCAIGPAQNTGDELIILNNAVTETGFDLNIQIVTQTDATADVLTIEQDKNYYFLFDASINRYIDVSPKQV